jgi:amidase
MSADWAALDIASSTALTLRDAIRAGHVTSLEITEHFLSQIEAENPHLGAFVTVTAESALAEAAAADRRTLDTPRAERAHLPILHGLPIAHKDLIDVTGSITTHGSRALAHRVAAADSPIAHTLRGAGAISLGKTQVPELGLASYSENEVAPPARNPRNADRSPGGSSGGAAAAVAAGLLPFSPGSDGGGSVRIPALACGLVGLKPGFGAVPADLAQGRIDPFGAPRLVVSGPLARTALDAALLYDAMVGEPQALNAVLRADELGPLRIGVSAQSPFEATFAIALSPEARAAHQAGMAHLTAAGHHLEEAQFHYDPRYFDAFTTVWTSALALLELTADDAARLGTLAGAFRRRSMATDPEKIREAGVILHDFAAAAAAQWGRYDAILTPGLASRPPHIGAHLALSADEDYRQQCLFTPFTSMVNVAGLPAVAVPTLAMSTHAMSTAATPNAMPMGVQLIGPRGSEIRLLQLAAQIEARRSDG